MVNFSKKYLDENLRRDSWKDLASRLGNKLSHRELRDLLYGFLSPGEQIVFEKRVLILYLLGRGWTYGQIAEALDVSRSAISFVKNGFKRRRKGKKNYQSRVSSVRFKYREKREKGWSLMPPITGRGRWRI
ncbi:helix-turn-helix domain-containing protein [Candidatus Wolfebacteria bacterium]|nr:helix-turn-helix domain-containing protein [Candidatus Wolfebacteria bacterium]